MSTFNPDQALARWIELWEKRHEEFDQDKHDFEYICGKMTVEEYEHYLEWEKEE